MATSCLFYDIQNMLCSCTGAQGLCTLPCSLGLAWTRGCTHRNTVWQMCRHLRHSRLQCSALRHESQLKPSAPAACSSRVQGKHYITSPALHPRNKRQLTVPGCWEDLAACPASMTDTASGWKQFMLSWEKNGSINPSNARPAVALL